MEKPMEYEGLYNTKDFNTITLLKHHNIKFKEVKVGGNGDPPRTKRVFVQDTPELRKLLLDYENGELTVDAKAYMRSVEETKEFVHR